MYTLRKCPHLKIDERARSLLELVFEVLQLTIKEDSNCCKYCGQLYQGDLVPEIPLQLQDCLDSYQGALFLPEVKKLKHQRRITWSAKNILGTLT